MKLYTILETILKSESCSIKLIDSQGNLMLNKIHDLIDNTDKNLIGLLLENQEIREKFFIKIKEVYVFKTSDFKFFLDENKIDNSYTQYENRIGLTVGGKFLKDSSDVVLDFPYKDCILEGGQSTEEGTDTYFEYDANDNHYQEKQAKRKEVFFNTILAKDEIDRLLEPKAFTNIKKYSDNGEEIIKSFERDENRTIKDNLIIKGNNLLALHTLKSEFAGKVKLIYIDPPYNTGNDSFAYNDNFNHSTWLTFMRNRLLIAKELLKEDGNIFIQIDDFEDAYLKVLMDDIFGKINFRNKITWKRRGGSANPTTRLNNVVDYILWYSKSENFLFKPQFTIDDDNTKNYIKERFNNVHSDGRKFMLSPIERNSKLGLRENLRYEYNGYIPEYGWMLSKDKLIDFDKKSKLHWNGKNKPNRRVFIDEYEGQPISCLWNDIKVINPMSSERGNFESGQKPEALLQRIIEMTTNKKDIFLDFHLGSGSSSSVAHKMERQYIGIEQMDYIEEFIVGRLKKVIGKTNFQNTGNDNLESSKNEIIYQVVKQQELYGKFEFDKGGISKSVNWQGGGSFVYLELAKNNQNAIEFIQSCVSYEDLVTFFDEMCNKYFLHYNLKIKEFREIVSKEQNFKNLTLDQQKIMFAKMLDLNQLYVNVSDMEDNRYNLTENDIALTKDFYQI